MWRILFLVLTLTACSSFPELDEAVPFDGRKTDFPELVPIRSLDLTPGLSANEQDELTSGIEGRVAALKARASRLRGPVLDRRTKRRMQRGVDLP